MSLEKVDQSYVPLSTCQPSSADQRPPCFISSASPLCGCSFCPGCTRTTATCCRAPARCRRAPARLWAAPCGCRAPARCRRCPTLSTRHSRMVTRVMCLCLQISQAPSWAKQCCSKAALLYMLGISTFVGVRSARRAPARCCRAPARCWAPARCHRC